MPQQPNDRYIPWQLGATYDHAWTIKDRTDDSILRQWRGRKHTYRIWHATEQEAETLATLMNKPAPAALGKVTLIGDLDPPTRENAKQWAIYQAKSRKKIRPKHSPNTAVAPTVPFQECPNCHAMSKATPHCPPP